MHRPACPESFNDDERDLDRLEPAWADAAHALRGELRYMRDTPGVERVNIRGLSEVHAELEGHRQRFEGGKQVPLLAALNTVLTEGLPAPYWLAAALRQRIGQVLGLHGTLQDAFGGEAELPTTPKRQAKARLDLKREWAIWKSVNAAKREGLSLSAAIQQAARAHGVGATRARELYLRRAELHAKLAPRSSRTHKLR